MTGRPLLRVVFPEGEADDVLPLFLDIDPRGNHSGVRVSRRSLHLEQGSHVSTATYFNGFPASYWRRWTSLREVRLRMRVRGQGGQIRVHRSNASGQSHEFARISSDATAGGWLSVTLPLEDFEKGGWYWFDIEAGDVGLVVSDAEYVSDRSSPRGSGTSSVVVTTFNRPEQCSLLIGQLADAADGTDVIDEVIVVDQGGRRVEDSAAFAGAAQRLGARLTVIRQPNLGGSGGFARGMSEVLARGASDYVILLDDDVEVEVESLRRAVIFADWCSDSTVVGGHMFSSVAVTSLHSMGEVVDPRRFWWGPAEMVDEDHDFAVGNLRETAWAHRRVDVDYNGWWMCLIPTSLLRAIGLALPLFIKWDDAEYGLRARAAGADVISLPGVAVWHVPWSHKNDTVDWQAYFHTRNRLVAALLHARPNVAFVLVAEELAHQLKYVLSMRYSTAAVRLQAWEDILTGPAHLWDTLHAGPGRPNQIRSRYPDAQAIDVDQSALADPVAWAVPERPRTRAGVVSAVLLAVARQALPVGQPAPTSSQRLVQASGGDWWALARLDTAVVVSRDGSQASRYRRDRATSAGLAGSSVATLGRLLVHWRQLAATYRKAAPTMTDPDSWREFFIRLEENHGSFRG